ncbi:TPA: RNA-dependent DNA polymerase, partial [Klebsiella quasipneumoniae subsp. similipneumoniae]|nr:RNA-dependent DNA polymerase [Klebsiella quasipneumoniae subsp. similipneumoniae]
MSLHEKLLMLRLATANKQATDQVPDLPKMEPEPYKTGGRIKWNNKKLKNNSQTPNEDIIKICQKIENKSIIITSANDIANVLEVPVGQLLYILYDKKDNYRQFEIEKKNG